jgi:hypothetical protein
MSLRIRRGTDAQRQGTQFDLGEPVFTTDTKKLYIGDGVTQGANNILATSAGIGMSWNATTQKLDCTVTGGGGGGGGGIASVSQDTAPTLGGNLTLNSHNIQGTGNINITGSLSTTGTALIGGGLAGNLSLNNYGIVGTGNINISGPATLTTVNTSLISPSDTGNGLVITSLIGKGISASFYAGSKASPTTVGTGPTNGMSIGMKGWNGTTYTQAGVIISFFETGATLTDVQPKSTITLVSGAGGSTAYYAGLNSSGIFSAPALMAAGPAYATGGAAGYNGSGSYPSPAVAGMIIFDSSNSHFYGYNGTTWKQLDN